MMLFFFYVYDNHRDLHGLTHSVPTRRSSDLNLPALTEERRRELSKVVHGEGEDSKVAIRNIRRDANHQLKELLKDKQVSEDEATRCEADRKSTRLNSSH